MLSPRQIPSVEVIGVLNERLRAWAAARPNVRLFPIADFVTRAKGDGVTVDHDGAAVRLDRDALLQGDGLHATRLGVALLAHEIGGQLRALLPADDPLRPREVSFHDLVQVVGAEVSFDEVLDAARPPAASGGGR